MPRFKPAGSASLSGWQACRAVDLNGDGAIDLVVDGEYVRNENADGWPFQAASPVKLDAGRQPCFLDIDRDGDLDASAQWRQTLQPDFYRVAWRKNLWAALRRRLVQKNRCQISTFQVSAVGSRHESPG